MFSSKGDESEEIAAKLFRCNDNEILDDRDLYFTCRVHLQFFLTNLFMTNKFMMYDRYTALILGVD